VQTRDDERGREDHPVPPSPLGLLPDEPVQHQNSGDERRDEAGDDRICHQQRDVPAGAEQQHRLTLVERRLVVLVAGFQIVAIVHNGCTSNS
jgi:hypothetical protein